CIGNVVIVFLGQQATQHRYGRAHDVHRVAGGRQGLEGGLQLNRQATQAAQLLLVCVQFGTIGEFAVNQQVGDFLEFAAVGDIENVVTAVVQIIARAAHRAKRGVAGDHAREGNRFLGLGFVL